MIAVEHADCIEAMARLDALGSQFDSIICDPPYHLTSITKRFGKPGAAPPKVGQTGAFVRASAGFMGKAWDGGDVAFQVETWRLAYALLKPGGYLVAFGGTRTYHRLASAIEDAGFEIRDSICWHYGTGFPKSHDVSKALDKRRDDDVRPVCRYLRAAMDALAFKSRHLVSHFGDCNARLIDHWAARDTDSQPNCPTWGQWVTLKTVLALGDEMDAEVWRLNGRKGTPGKAWAERAITGTVEEWTDRSNYALTSADGLRRDVASSAAAQEWQGWGTALKPATEIICLARKPLIGTVAENVLAYGVGAMNIGGCRIGTSERVSLGRWPANLIHDGSEEIAALFPAASGQQGRVCGTEPSAPTTDVYGDFRRISSSTPRGDAGSAARFFYGAKARRADRWGTTHPTVKPIALMRWLVRLVTPPGGRVLDPFAGSGSTGIAAHQENRRALLIERDPQYVAEIRARLAHFTAAAPAPLARKARVPRKAVTEPKAPGPVQLPLFA